ncbi:hypothetical protein [Mycolicibacter sinensis]|uniref:Low molecular weight antigen MTB12-like C-terminal domain-containing protein n=1 Tax=Mycolicibacter sinensis (strain JDM601) TaxID=875328 RepID=A0A1A3U2K5_MYCSD|nr:hypothetical protein [Mycolicibacter sinensis]MDD7814884.1 hypothetical protein [Mycobacterium sp. CSUR Q5927]OBK88922.1 hypothetical protein A5648_21135 [Mycolicibacter sinensis]
MSVKLLIIGLGAVAAIAAPGTAIAETPSQPPLTVFHAPHPQEPPPAAGLPSAEQLTGILDDLVDPRVSDEVKSGLVAGGLQRHQADVLDHQLRRLGHHGGLPLTFTASDIASTGPDTVTADVTATGPTLPAPITKPVTFTNENGWMLSQNGADELMEEVVGRLPH